jgi:hypothetical protein
MDEKFFNKWFGALNNGLEKMSIDECSRLFAGCAETCSRDALKYLYRDLFDSCDGNLDMFFTKVGEKKNVEGRVVESGRVYELSFTNCDCPLHTDVNVNSTRLCECSRQSMICVFRNLVPDRDFRIECISSILSGDDKCCHRIVFEEGKVE